MIEPRRILVVGKAAQGDGSPTVLPVFEASFNISADSVADGLRAAGDPSISGLFFRLDDQAVRSQSSLASVYSEIVEALKFGVAVADASKRIVWCNRLFQDWTGCESMGGVVGSSWTNPAEQAEIQELFQRALDGQPSTMRWPSPSDRALELEVRRAATEIAEQPTFILVLQDETSIEFRQRKLDALHHAGQALNGISAEELAETGFEDRIEIFKENLKHCTRDILHYDFIEIRILDRDTQELKPLLQEGMAPNAINRPLFARREGNGVTGVVAATGKSYLCVDTAKDPYYLEGAVGARSSLTVPLKAGDQVIGTLNIESPRANGFTEDDRQFTEIFAREVAQALHTLDLLQAEKRTTGSASVEAIDRDIAIPLDDILAASIELLASTAQFEPEDQAKLQVISAAARSIKSSMTRAGASYAPSQRSTRIPERLQGLRVLVIDGNVGFRQLAHTQISRLGCLVETVRTAREALALVRYSSYDAILLDVKPPDMSGYEAYRQLKAALPNARFVMTAAFGYDSNHSIVKARQDGLRSVIFKPYRQDQLIASLAGEVPN